MNQFFKKVDERNCTHYVNRQDSFKGIRILLSDNHATVDNLYCAHDTEYTEITQEEFTEAFDKAIAMISRNMLIAA